jgi:hypothetical protein
MILLVAAAVVVPVTLIVLPRQQQQANLATCPTSSACSNGGVSVVSGNACRCVCVNGFTGDHCTIAGDTGCITTDVGTGTSSFKNATIGSSIPRLLTGSETNYSIPLNSSALLALFSSNNLSCSSENALVTFNGQAQKRSLLFIDEDEANRILANPFPTPIHMIRNAHDIFPRQNANHAATSNGIVFAATSTFNPSSSPTSSNVPQDVFVNTQTTDFARVVILFILQQTGNLTSAVSSQERIQSFFENPTTNTTMGGGGGDPNFSFTINFQTFTIQLANGTKIGGRGPSPSATPTSTAGAKLRRDWR